MTSDQFAAIIEHYKNTIPEKISNVEKLINDAKAKPSKETITAVKDAVHKIAGSAGSYGYENVTTMCREMEKYFMQYIEHPEQINGPKLNQDLDLFFEKLKSNFLNK